MSISQLVLPLITLFTEPECRQQSDWAHAIIALREQGWSQDALTAIPIAALVTGHIGLGDAVTAVESIRTVWAWRSSAWEARLTAYERCVGEDLEEERKLTKKCNKLYTIGCNSARDSVKYP